MAKHVFRNYGGSLFYEGPFLRATEKMVFYNCRNEERRAARDATLIVETENPEETVRLFQERFNGHNEHVREANKALNDCLKEQREDAMSTLTIVEP